MWTPDGQRLVWGSGALFWQAADGTGAVERLAESDTSGLIPYAVTPDGTRLILRADGPGTGADLMVLALNGNRAITPLIQTTFNERNAEISADGRWLAYESDESGQSEVYVRPFPAVNVGRWQVSTAGGRQPLWAGSGREIFYRALDGALLGVSADVVGEGGFRVGTPATLLEGRFVSVSSQSDTERADVAREREELATQPEFEKSELASIYVARGLTPELATQVAEQLMTHDALAAHSRDELGLSEAVSARPVQAALTSAATFAVGAALPLLTSLVAREPYVVSGVAGTSLVCLTALGALSARAGGASVLRASARVAFWGALAMGLTAGVGRLFGAVV